MKKVIGLVMLLLINVSLFAGPGPGGGGPPKFTPIDTNEIVLIIAAVLLTVGVVAYRKLSIKKA